jgi:hypothetical protein
MKRIMAAVMCAGAVCMASAYAQDSSLADLAVLRAGKTAAQNALWIETPLERQFKSSKRVIVADIKGPAVITMIHFAMPEMSISKPKEYTLGRDVMLRMYWDGEQTPSVDVPMVDFFCDPAGLREAVNTALVNKRRGFNAYFPMHFAQSAKIELVYDGPAEPGDELWRIMPCYSYVMYRELEKVPADVGYFHATWRQDLLPLASRDYLAMEAKGNGKFVGWNVTVRLPGRANAYPVDENEKFFVDGEPEASIEFQGLEDSFGFSWGFPPTESLFPLTGFFPFKDGAAAYRFFVNDAIRFEKSLKVAIGFGKNEDSFFKREFAKAGNELELSSTCYWYQTEPHAPLAKLPGAKERAPSELSWKDREKLPTPEEMRARGVKLHMRCGRPENEVVFADAGYGAQAKSGYVFAGWPFPVFHCRADDQDLRIELAVPKASAGTVRLYVIDPDNFQGGRKQEVSVAGKSLGIIDKFAEGRWLEAKVSPEETSDGKVMIDARNLRKESNAVISVVEWVAQKK